MEGKESRSHVTPVTGVLGLDGSNPVESMATPNCVQVRLVLLTMVLMTRYSVLGAVATRLNMRPQVPVALTVSKMLIVLGELPPGTLLLPGAGVLTVVLKMVLPVWLLGPVMMEAEAVEARASRQGRSTLVFMESPLSIGLARTEREGE